MRFASVRLVLLIGLSGCAAGAGSSGGPSGIDASTRPDAENGDHDASRHDDGGPSFDIDTDGDGLSDEVEGAPSRDVDRDGIPDYLDDDSDNDTLTDAQEAGDQDLNTPAIDSDGDTIPDYLDPDSDGDGLSDRNEVEHESDPRRQDTDGDGVSDLVEVGSCPNSDASCALDVTSPGVSPRTRGDFVFVVPYTQPPSPERDTLQFATTLRRADVYFLMDNTGSMGGTIAALQTGLREHVIPDTRAVVPDSWFGVGGFDDFPIATHGASATADTLGLMHDLAFFQYAPMTDDPSALQAAVDVYRVNAGSDTPESGISALYALMTGDTLGGYARFPGMTASACPAGRGRGAACFRDDAMPIIVMMTDADQHGSPTCTSECAYDARVRGARSFAETTDVLAAANARMVGIATKRDARPFLERVVSDTTLARGVSGTASDYVIDAINGTGLTSAVALAIERAAAVPLSASARAIDVVDPGETVNAIAAFVDTIETHNLDGTTGSALACTGGFFVVDRDGIDDDARPDTFMQVSPGTPICFDVIPKINTTVPATNAPQLYRARIEVVGEGFTPLDTREVYFLVPPIVTYDGPLY